MDVKEPWLDAKELERVTEKEDGEMKETGEGGEEYRKRSIERI